MKDPVTMTSSTTLSWASTGADKAEITASVIALRELGTELRITFSLINYKILIGL
jgi:hypothetical protein